MSVVTTLKAPRRLAMDVGSRCIIGHLTYAPTATTGGTLLRQPQTPAPRRLMRPAGGLVRRTLGPRLATRLEGVRDPTRWRTDRP